ncbi:MAG: hypothetical protein H0U70_09720 [Tatlockia sp.]|nr:hypothetical protein [Tatlockia sp.]
MHLQSYIKDIRKDGRRCFTIEKIVEQFQVSRSHARVSLHRLLKTGDVISPARGLYVIFPPEHQPHGSIPAQDKMQKFSRKLKEFIIVSKLPGRGINY